MLRQTTNNIMRRATALGVSRLHGGLPGCIDLPMAAASRTFCPQFNSATVTFRKVVGVIKTTSWHRGTFSPKQQLARSDIAKDCFLTLVKKRLALGSPGCLLVTMPKMAQYTGKWLLLSPYWSHPRPHKMGKRDE